MTKLKRALVWFLMLTKRLVLQWGFVIMLCAIPIVVSLTNVLVSDDDNGILHIALSYEEKDEAVEKVITKLMEEDSVIQYKLVPTPDEARLGVKNNTYDVAWIFPKDFKEKLDAFIKSDNEEPFIEIFLREETIPIRIAKQKLFSAIYSDFSYSIYKNFVYEVLVTDEQVSEEEVLETYSRMPREQDIIEVEKLNAKVKKDESSNYLNAPIRGLLSLIVMLCTLTGAMYYLKDMQEGKYDWLPYRKRILPAWASCLAGSSLACLTMLVAVLISGIGTGFLNEILPTILFALAAAGFGTVFCIIVRSPGKLGALIPGIIIVMLALSPIFFNVRSMLAISYMLPTYHYLYAIHNVNYFWYYILYCIAVYAVVFVLNMLVSNIKGNKSIL